MPNDHDPRTETRRPADFAELKAAGHVDTADGWRVRRDLLLKKARVYTRLEQLLDGARANTMSLAVFKPTEVLDFKVEEDERDWDPQKVERMRALTSQMDLFEDNAWRETFKLIPKLPYSFSYRFTDADGRESTLQILDWEIGALFWNCVRSEKGDEKAAIAKVRHKYTTEFLRKDIHFFLGTTLRWHSVAPNPWLIIGVLPIPKERQLALL